MTSTRHRVAVIGTGYWGVNHVRILTELESVESVVACDSSDERRRLVAERFPGVDLSADPAEIASDHSIDSVVVCTPATSHLEVALPLLDAGKHLLMEKPITVRADDAEVIIAAANRAGVTLAVGHTFLFNPGVAEVKRRLDSGISGDINYLYARRCNLGPIRADVNALWDLAPHDVSIFNHLVGRPAAWVSAVAANLLGNERHDVGFVTIGYDGGVVCNIHASWADPFKVRQIVMVGTKERVTFDDTNPEAPVSVVPTGVRAPRLGEPDPYVVEEHPEAPVLIERSEPLKNQTIDFLQAVETGRPPVSTGETGLRVVEVMEAIDASITASGAPTPVQRRSTTNQDDNR